LFLSPLFLLCSVFFPTSISCLMIPPPPVPTLFPYTTLFRSRPSRQSSRAPTGRRSYPRCTGRDGWQLPGRRPRGGWRAAQPTSRDRKSTRLNSSHVSISYAVFCLKKKKTRAVEHIRLSTPTH